MRARPLPAVSESRIKRITQITRIGLAGRAEGADDTDAVSRAEDADWAAQVVRRSQVVRRT